MIKTENGMIYNADVHFYPEMAAKQIEIAIAMERGNAMLRVPDTDDTMINLYRVFGTDSINALKGQYCRVMMDEMTGRIDSIKNIIYDKGCEIQDNPVI